MMATEKQRELEGVRVLIVEDDAMLAMALEMALSDLGCEIVALASNLADAVPLAAEVAVDGAILDVNLAGEMIFPVADILTARGIPFIFATGYGSDGLRDCDRDRPVLQKPYQMGTLAKVARQWRQSS